MFGAIGDSAPDRWGRALMRRKERRRAEREKRTPRTLFEIDYLLFVDDETRAGALRFKADEGEPFLRESDAGRASPLVDLPKLLSAAQRVIDEDETDDGLRLLLAPQMLRNFHQNLNEDEVVLCRLFLTACLWGQFRQQILLIQNGNLLLAIP
jgi:hypothetical protein